MLEYISKNNLRLSIDKYKCDEKLARIIPSNPEARRTRSKNIVDIDTFWGHLDSHIDVAPTSKRKEVLERLRKHGMVAEVSKTAFFTKWVEFCGHILEGGARSKKDKKKS